MSFEIPREEVERMEPEGFIDTYTYSNSRGDEWIQHNEVVNSGCAVRGLVVFKDGYSTENGIWGYYSRGDLNRRHYRTLDDLVQDCPNEELLALFLKERCG